MGGIGGQLTVRVLGQYATLVGADSLLKAAIEVQAHPFHGTIETLITSDDLAAWSRDLREFAAGAQRCKLGGDRAAEVVLERDGTGVEIAVTPSGDDPWPQLRYLVFNAQITSPP